METIPNISKQAERGCPFDEDVKCAASSSEIKQVWQVIYELKEKNRTLSEQLRKQRISDKAIHGYSQ